MIPRAVVLALGVAALAAQSLAAQQQSSLRTSVIYESYSVGEGLIFKDVSELTVPVVLQFGLSRTLGLTISSGYASLSLTSADTTQLGHQQASGALDTEFRLTASVAGGRLVAIATGALPTGMKTLEREQLSLVGVASSDIIGFTAGSLGSGGNVGGGFAGAMPLGRWALGYGATYRQQLQYQPIVGLPESTVTPGSELRLRGGLEGPLARRTYVRFAGVYAARAKDKIAGQTRHGIGNRLVGYLALSQGLGARGSLVVYAFDVFRGDPQVEPTITGAALFPRGNLLGTGVRLTVPLGATMSATPRVEYRVSAAATDTADTVLRRAGSSVRFGADLRMDLGRRATLVFVGSGVSGAIVQAGEEVSLSGFRGGVHLEYRP